MPESACQPCRICARPLADAGTDGVCPACLWESFLQEDPGLPQSEGDRSLFQIPGHEILRELARGGMGIVYQARQLEPPREVAVKMLLPFQASSPGMRERFRIEARAIASLDHPGILPIYQVGDYDGTPYFTLKLAPGGSLAVRRGRLAGKWREIAVLVARVADAVQFAHEHGVLHRDLKPGNILFDENDRAYVSDFGLAKELSTDTDLTRSTDFLGTPHYVAPEVAARSARAATIASDVYSLGAILYELLAGRPPFEAEGMPALLKKIAEDEPAMPLVVKSEIRNSKSEIAGLPRDLEIICLKCLAKETARRYASARELAEDLRRWLAGLPIQARPATLTERAVLWTRRNRGLAAALGTALFLLVALVVGLSVAAMRIADSRRVALRTVEALEAKQANDVLEAGSTADGLAMLARRVRDDPRNRADAARLMWALQHRRWAVPAGTPVQHLAGGGSQGQLAYSAATQDRDGRMLALFLTSVLVVHDIGAGSNRHQWPLPLRGEGMFLEDAAETVGIRAPNNQVLLIHYPSGKQLGPVLTGVLVRVSADRRYAFVAAPDKSGQIIDLATGNSRTLAPPRAPGASGDSTVYPHASFFPDGERVAISARDRAVRIVRSATGEPAGPTLVADKPVEFILVSPDARRIVTETLDGLQLWDVTSGRQLPGPPPLGTLFAHGAFHPSRPEFYLGGNARGLAVLDTERGGLVRPWNGGALAAGHCLVDASGRWISAGFETGVAVFDAVTGQPRCEPVPHEQARLRPAILAGEDFVTVGREGLMVQWTAKSNRLAPVIVRHAAGIQSARFSPDGRRVVTASEDGSAQVWEAASGKPIGDRLTHSNRVWSACFSPDGRAVATASWDGSARLWDANTGAAASAPLRAKSYVFHVEFSPDGRRLLAAGEDGVVRIYEVATGELVLQLPHPRPVYWAGFSPDARWIATRPLWTNPHLWRADTGQLVKELIEPPPHQSSAPVVCRGDFSEDGQWLALGSHNRYATVWRLPEGKLHAVLPHAGFVRTATFDPTGRSLLTTADGLTGQLWDATTGEATSAPLTHALRANAVPNSGNSLRAGAISPDGRYAVTGGSDGAIRIWDARSGLPAGDPLPLGGPVMSAEFSRDASFLLVACLDGTASVWSLPPPVTSAPQWLPPLAEALVGRQFNSRGAVESVSPTALWEVCERLRRAPVDDVPARWARDFLGL